MCVCVCVGVGGGRGGGTKWRGIGVFDISFLHLLTLGIGYDIHLLKLLCAIDV